MNKLAPFTLALALVSCETPLRSAAATAQVAPRLPNAVLGHYWCFIRAPNDDPHLILPDVNFDACANRGGARFWRRGGKWGFQLGRFDWRADCEISKIDRVPSKGPKVYRVHSYCRAKGEMFVGDPLKGAKVFELWQSKTGMHWRESEEDRKPDISWNCGGTIVNYADEDLGPSTAGVGPDGKPIGNDERMTLWVVKPPADGFVFTLHSTPHAYATWRAELNGKPCERQAAD
jgi:hypothetical protein